MRIIILSDSHDNIVRLKHVIGFAKECKAGAIIHCGDWNTPLAVKQFEPDLIGFDGVKIPVYGVLGNADIDPRMQQVLKETNINFNESFLKLEFDGKHIGVSHYPTLLEEIAQKEKFDIGFCGHTHRRRKWESSNTLLVNPGALHKTLEPSFAVYDTETNKVEIIDVAV
ncbi:MAG: phosphodiesterase, MJ0936 family [Microgenomates group bacterium Gr01-1014_5]|nr:MAG: phosphodiesterase, MJ0936 family [Microgenomates group bacterium Gr01-1014_5]